MNEQTDDRSLLFRLNAICGEDFGTEDFSFFLYSLIRMLRPRSIVELGTGLGISALWMALAARENGEGHVWTVDNFEWFERRPDRAAQIVSRLQAEGIVKVDGVDAAAFYSALGDRMELNSAITFVKGQIELNERNHFDIYSFHGRPIDFLFSDFKHGGKEILALLAHFLPRLSDAASILIHSASTSWSSYLLLEQLVAQLNAGHVPATLQAMASQDLLPCITGRRVTLVHLVEKKERKQNSAAWLKFEPIDVFPYPRVKMRD